jgi:H+/gluconate symporter-like permease
MSITCFPRLVVIALAGITGSASVASASAAPVRQFSGTTLLYQAPTADVLLAGARTVSASVTYSIVNTPRT